MSMGCDFKGCKREAVSCGNMIISEDGIDYEVCLCKLHLMKLIGDQIREEVKEMKE
jgi:hypothetical protein